MEYVDVVERTRYVWDHYQGLMTDFERRVGTAILGRMKAATYSSPSTAKKLAELWGEWVIRRSTGRLPREWRRFAAVFVGAS